MARRAVAAGPRRAVILWRVTAEENIALTHRGFEAFSRGDFDASVADMHPEIEWHVAFRLPDLPFDKPIYRGPAEVKELWTAFSSVWAELTATVEEVIEARNDLVVARVRFVGTGGGSGIEVDRTLFYVADIVGGRLRRLRPFDTEAEALAAAGIESRPTG